MNAINKLKVISLSLLTFTMVLTLGSINIVRANSLTLFDTFSSLPLKPASDAQWWIINWGADENGQTRIVDDYCASNSCTLQQVDNDGTDYARLVQYPGQVEGIYYNAELSELETGFSYGQPTQWTPEVGHPIVFETRARWSDDFQLDGSGGGTGSNGFWLWNSPIDLANNVFHPVDSIGFEWTASGSAYGAGLTMSAINDTVPVMFKTVKDINLQDWNTFRVEWYQTPGNVQLVVGYVNDNLVGVIPVVGGLSNLSFTAWNDNQHPTFEGVIFVPATSEQSVDFDYVSVSKL